MIQVDLGSAREKWLEETKLEQERTQRESSDFLKYRDQHGRYADFHATRHTFITNLSKVATLTVTQKLARHSDPRLTANVYTHVDMEDRAASINSLKAPPVAGLKSRSSRAATPNVSKPEENVVARGVAQPNVRSSRRESPNDATGQAEHTASQEQNPLPHKNLGVACRQVTPKVGVHPTGLEPVTFGSVVTVSNT